MTDQPQPPVQPGAFSPQPTYPPPTAPPPGMAYGQPPYPQYLPQAAPGIGLSVGGIICGALAFLFLPIILGPIGIVLGAIAKSKGQRYATLAVVLSIVGMVVGMLLGVLYYTAVNK